MNTQIVSELASPKALSGEQSVEWYTDLWLRAYPATGGSKRHFRLRLKELESWDTSNNKPNERAGKIEALKIILK